ncbi:hypothetical protein [Sediminispirochaeta bajacaliforniensis]|uniref:hypothetical protein n=1 Tax=Sediminispirochaeta bajacaliforniensis TaxID=148 RepID=UPI00036C066D|nr:hypothetical protein [Sediminispirochaeta bajacaliforniensis]
MNTQKLHPQFVLNQDGERTSVILPIEEFYELLEDIEDLATVAERRGEPTVPFDVVLKGLGIQENV